MTNVFDLIEEFYTQDEEWNTVLQQACAEDFLRYKTWQGAKDGELVKILGLYYDSLYLPWQFRELSR